LTPIWQIQLFGGLRGRSTTGADFAPGVSRAGTLFAYLALTPDRTHSRDFLAALFWPDADAATARTRLRQELSALRRQLEPEGVPEGSILARERDSVGLVPGSVVTDVGRFRDALADAHKTKDDAERERLLDEAVTLCRGELLPGYDYEGLEPERAHLSQCYESALRELAGLRQARGELEGAEACLRRLVAQNPYLEEAHADLMRLYAARGEPTRIREQYRELERTLVREFGDAPTEATRQLMERLCQEAAVERAAPLRAAMPVTPSSACEGVSGDCRVPVTEPAAASPGSALPLPHPTRKKPALLRRGAAGLLTLLACLVLPVTYRLSIRPQPSRSAAAPAPKPGLAGMQWNQEAWVYPYKPGPGEQLNSEPKAMTVNETANETEAIFVTGLTQTDKEDADILTLKLSPNGTLRWARRYSSPEHDCDRAVGSVSPNGTLRWARRYSSPEHDCDRAFSIANDLHGGVYVAGESFVPARPGVPEGWRLVVLRYDANGTLLWARRAPVVTKNGDGSIQVVAPDANGCWAGGTALVKGVPHLLVMRYDLAGNLLWANTASCESRFARLSVFGEGYACGHALQRDANGVHMRWLVVRFERDGKRLWETTVKGPGKGGGACSIVKDVATTLYVGGVFETGSLGQGGHGPQLGVASLSAEDGQVRWTHWQEQMPDIEMRFAGLSLLLPGPREELLVAGTRVMTDGTSHPLVQRYDTSGMLLWERQHDAPPGYQNADLVAVYNDWLGVALTGNHTPYQAHGDLLAAGLNEDGFPDHVFAHGSKGTGGHILGALIHDFHGGVYLAAQTYLPQGPTLTVTRFQNR
jgi:DNA-binding SARP family transcriptional activator